MMNRLEKVKEALEFYADEKLTYGAWLQDDGERANEALTEMEGK